MQCGSFPVILTHRRFPCPSAYTASECVVMVSTGCVWVCEALIWWELRDSSKWQRNMARKNYPIVAHSNRLPGSQGQAWEYVWFTAGKPVFEYIIARAVSLSCFELGHLSLLHLQEFLNRASGMTVKYPHAFLLSRWLISWFSLTCRNKVPKKIKMWWVHFSCYFIWPAKMSYWFAQ